MFTYLIFVDILFKIIAMQDEKCHFRCNTNILIKVTAPLFLHKTGFLMTRLIHDLAELFTMNVKQETETEHGNVKARIPDLTLTE